MAHAGTHECEIVLAPGNVRMPQGPTTLCAIVSSGAAVCGFDTVQRKGAMAHFCLPYRGKDGSSTALYAGPAIVGLIRMLQQNGSQLEDLEIFMAGGAVNERAEGFVKGLSENNIKVGLEILGKLGLAKVSMDTGGTKGRKVIFNTGSGKIALQKVESLRSSDWYPC